MTEIARALLLFALARLAEIGGWLVRQWLREGRPWPWGLVEALVLISFGVILTFQNSPHFGRIYAAYGGMFIVLSLLWRRVFDGFKADRWDLLGLSAEVLPDRCVGGLRAPCERAHKVSLTGPNC